MRDLATLTAKDFEEQIDTVFQVTEEKVELTLHSVDTSRDSPERRSFSVLFRSDAEIGQRTYQLTHQVMGELDLFVVPIGPAKDGGLLYEAVFG